LADRYDRETIASSAKHDLRVLDLEIQTLDRGDAIISTIGIPFPISCHVHRYEDYIE
ncbi:MAG: ATP-binding protein, partial [Methanomicrobiales archaeon HGW-Methanomicrobiales-4]